VPTRPRPTIPHIRFLFPGSSPGQACPALSDWASSRLHLTMTPSDRARGRLLLFSLPSAPRKPGMGTSTPYALGHARHTRIGFSRWASSASRLEPVLSQSMVNTVYLAIGIKHTCRILLVHDEEVGLLPPPTQRRDLPFDVFDDHFRNPTSELDYK